MAFVYDGILRLAPMGEASKIWMSPCVSAKTGGKDNMADLKITVQQKAAVDADKDVKPAPKKPKKQAVVVIHGIGEQHPMDTLRGFVNAVVAPFPADGGFKYLSMPESVSDSYEMRCFIVPEDPEDKEPWRTEFYECYWAHLVQGTNWEHIKLWLWYTLRHPIRLIRHTSWPVVCSWVIIALVALWFIIKESAWSPFSSLVGTTGLLLFFLEAISGYFFLKYLGDAARYLTPDPDNIEVRERIRRKGIEMLLNLHKSGEYSRIIVVGHSLGSIIGYDIIRHLWDRLREPENPKSCKQPPMEEAFERLAKEFSDGFPLPTAEKIADYQTQQQRLWEEYRQMGIPWLVTDFITLGSPLRYAELLLAPSRIDFDERKKEYEYPCCPPRCTLWPGRIEEIHYPKSYPNGATVSVPHHGAPFGCTRWTNLYFPYRKIILGDLIGGPLKGIFGHGINDIPVKPSRNGWFWLRRTFASHRYYWDLLDPNKLEPEENGREEISILALRKALALDNPPKTPPSEDDASERKSLTLTFQPPPQPAPQESSDPAKQTDKATTGHSSEPASG